MAFSNPFAASRPWPRFSAWDLGKIAFIIVATLWVYSPAFEGGWVWDDEVHIKQNKLIQQPDGMWKVWVRTDPQGDYYPLTAYVRWIEWQTFAPFTLGFHLVNVGLHLLSALLLWRLFLRLGLPCAWLGALLFAIYPIMVESVAWLTELKNTLSLPPLLLAMLAWLDWQQRRTAGPYALAVLCFVLSLLAKTAGMLLPFVLLLHAWWKQGTITRRDLLAVLPFIAVTLIFGGVTVLLEHGLSTSAAEYSQPDWHLGTALACAGWTILFLIGKCVLPIHLLPVYPGFAKSSADALSLLPWLALSVLLGLLWLGRRISWARHLVFGLGFFLLNIVPILVYLLLMYTIMICSLDHMLYVPIIGLIALVTAGLGVLDSRLAPPWRFVGRGAVTLWIALLAWDSHAHASWYTSSLELWTRTVQLQPNTPIAEQNLTNYYLDHNQDALARLHVERFLALQPTSADPYNLRGVILEKMGQSQAAEAQYRKALQVEPAKAASYLNLGELLHHTGQAAGAAEVFRQGLTYAPDSIDLLVNLAGILVDQGRFTEALPYYQHASRLNRDSAEIQYDYAAALLKAGNIPVAADHFATAIELDPNFALAHQSLGGIMAQLGRLPEAIEELQTALALNPTLAQARDNLARAYTQQGRIPEAIAQFQKELDYHPDDAQARDNLTRLKQYEQQHATGTAPK